MKRIITLLIILGLCVLLFSAEKAGDIAWATAIFAPGIVLFIIIYGGLYVVYLIAKAFGLGKKTRKRRR